MEKKIYLTLLLISIFFLGIALIYKRVISPYAGPAKSSGQYNLLSEVQVNSSTMDWKNASFANVSEVRIGTLSPQNALDVIGNISASGSLIGYYLQVNYVSGNLIPSSNLSFDLGSPSNWWRNLYVGGSIYLDPVNFSAVIYYNKSDGMIYLKTLVNYTLGLGGISTEGGRIYTKGGRIYTGGGHIYTESGSIYTQGGHIYTEGGRIYLNSSGPVYISYNKSDGIIYLISPNGISIKVFYDIDNQSYYVDPSNISILNTLYLTNVSQIPDNNKVLTIDSNGRISYIDTSSWVKGIGSGSTNYLAKWTSSNTLSRSIIYDTGSAIGIGTTSPAYTLDVAGDIGANNIYVSKICLNRECTAYIFYNNSSILACIRDNCTAIVSIS